MQWYHIHATGHFGYPQPEDSYAVSTYGDGYCDRCGIGGAQCIPFRLRSEPKSRPSQFLQLNWVFDEFFVRPEVESALQGAAISGIGFGPVLRNKTGEQLPTVRQLKVSTVLPEALDHAILQPVTCKQDNEEGPPWYGGGKPRYAPDYPYCGRVKYHWPDNLRFNVNAFADAPDVVKSFEWFGSGGAASRAVLVSERVIEVIEEHKWRGIKWTVVQFGP